MTEVTEAMRNAGRDVQRTWTHDLLAPDRFREIYLAMEAARIPAPAPDDVVRQLGDKLDDMFGPIVQCNCGDTLDWPDVARAALSAIPIPATGEVERGARTMFDNLCPGIRYTTDDAEAWEQAYRAALTDHTTKDDE